MRSVKVQSEIFLIGWMQYTSGMTTPTYLEATVLTFDTIPNGSQSTAQEVEVVNPLDVAGAAIDSDFLFFGGVRVRLTVAGTPGTITVRAFDGDPDAAGAEIYRAEYEFRAVGEWLSDRLGSDMVPCYDSIYITLEGAEDSMQATAVTYAVQGSLKAAV